MKTAVLSAVLFAAAPISYAQFLTLKNGIELNADTLYNSPELPTRDDARDPVTRTVRVAGMTNSQYIKSADLSCDLAQESVSWENDLLHLHFQGRPLDHPDFAESEDQTCRLSVQLGNRDKTKPGAPMMAEVKLESQPLLKSGWYINNEPRFQSLKNDEPVSWTVKIGDNIQLDNNGFPNGQIQSPFGSCFMQINNTPECQKIGATFKADQKKREVNITIADTESTQLVNNTQLSLSLNQIERPLTLLVSPVTWMADNKAVTPTGKPTEYELIDEGAIVVPMKMSVSFRLGFPQNHYGPDIKDEQGGIRWTSQLQRICLGSRLDSGGQNFTQTQTTSNQYTWDMLVKDCSSNSTLWADIKKGKPIFMADDQFLGLDGKRSFKRSSNKKLDERTTVLDLNLEEELKAIWKKRDGKAMVLGDLKLKRKNEKGEKEQGYSQVRLSLDKGHEQRNYAWLSYVNMKDSAHPPEGNPIALNGDGFGYGKSPRNDETKERNLSKVPSVKNFPNIDLLCYYECPLHGEWQLFVQDEDKIGKYAKIKTEKKLQRMAQSDSIHGFYLYQEWNNKTNNITRTRLSAHPKVEVEKTTVSIRWVDPDSKDGKFRTVVSLDMAIVPWDGVKYFWTGFGTFCFIFLGQIASCWFVSRSNRAKNAGKE